MLESWKPFNTLLKFLLQCLNRFSADVVQEEVQISDCKVNKTVALIILQTSEAKTKQIVTTMLGVLAVNFHPAASVTTKSHLTKSTLALNVSFNWGWYKPFTTKMNDAVLY